MEVYSYVTVVFSRVWTDIACRICGLDRMATASLCSSFAVIINRLGILRRLGNLKEFRVVPLLRK